MARIPRSDSGNARPLGNNTHGGFAFTPSEGGLVMEVLITDGLSLARDDIWGIVAVGLLIAIHLLQVYYAGRPADDDELLSRLAGMGNRSEYDLFSIAARKWRLPASTVKEDFRRYVLSGDLPYYIRDWLRKIRARNKNRCEFKGRCATGPL